MIGEIEAVGRAGESDQLRIGQIPCTTFFVQEDSLRSAGVSALPWTGAGYSRGLCRSCERITRRVRTGIRSGGVRLAVIRSERMIHVCPLNEILSFTLHFDIDRVENLQSLLPCFAGKTFAQ